MVSKDGNTIYHMAYDRSINTVFNKPNVFAGYDSVGTILEGFAIESADWNPKSDLFWASAGSYNDPATGYSNNTWYGYDVANDAIVDSFKWQFTVTNSANERPRGLAFSPDGNTAYVGYFGAGGPPSIQKFEQDLTPVNITFNVDMNIQIDEGLFNSSTGTIALAGSFNEWSTSANPMTDTDGDGIYSATIDALEPGTRVYFKFVKDGQLEENLKESPYENNNRSHVVTGGNTSYTAFYDDYLGSGIEIQFTFRCNMEVEILRGNFNPSGDVLYVKGTFNEFGETNPLTVTSDENIYEAVVPIKAFEGDVFDYYFAFGDMQEETISYTVKSADITTAVSTISRAFNGIRAEDVTEMEVTIVFQLDMRGAVNDVTKSAFDVVENVVLAGKAAPLQWPSAGWPDSDLNLVKQLNDNGEDGDLFAQDSIWGTTVTFPAYTHMFFEYKYGANWGLASNGGSNDNEASTGVLHRMDLSKDVLSAVAFDTWADMSPTNLDSIVSDVREIPASIPVSYVLEQNYPNPFNPTTNIRFAVPQADKVTLKVFDVLGQEVATLLDEFKNAGTYEATFDASRLSSGLYVYVLSTGKYVTSRKMMLLK
ncbi:MAG: T9SS type A sorting domain-containing protein [Melioribacteraceae bacterium]|nr:T9SS type A sorting domain-containing protein [Melioribacteraceae bacterium]